MTPEERELSIEQVTSAHRERSGRGEVRAAPAWHDLDADGRREAFARTLVTRRLEAAADPDGRSGTVKALLERIRRAP